MEGTRLVSDGVSVTAISWSEGGFRCVPIAEGGREGRRLRTPAVELKGESQLPANDAVASEWRRGMEIPPGRSLGLTDGLAAGEERVDPRGLFDFDGCCSATFSGVMICRIRPTHELAEWPEQIRGGLRFGCCVPSYVCIRKRTSMSYYVISPLDLKEFLGGMDDDRRTSHTFPSLIQFPHAGLSTK